MSIQNDTEAAQKISAAKNNGTCVWKASKSFDNPFQWTEL